MDFELVHRLVDSPPLDLRLEDWQPLYDLAMGFGPDLMLELGRGWGNSTCILTQAANDQGSTVLSVGFDSEHGWETRTAPRLLPHVGEDWFRPLMVIHGDILETDFRPILRGSKRTFVYWDAHGREIADYLFENLLPRLPSENLVVVDDVWDAQVETMLPPEHHAGPFASLFDEVEPLWDYLRDNDIPFEQHERSVSFTSQTGHSLRRLSRTR